MPSPQFRFRTRSFVRYNAAMVTQEQLRAHTGRIPYEPFWLRSGTRGTVYITEPSRGVGMLRRTAVSPDGDRLCWIRFAQVADHGVLSPPSSASSGNGE